MGKTEKMINSKSEEIYKALSKIKNDMLRAFLSLYWERGHYRRTITYREFNETLERYGFEVDRETREELKRAIELIKKITRYNKRTDANR